MALVSSLVGRLETPVKDGKSIATVYPIADGYILTAYHVFPDINDLSQSQVFWQRNDAVRNGELLSEGMPVTGLLYENKKYDIVIAKCETPKHLNLSPIIWHIGKVSGEWESIGFPKSGQDHRLEVRLKDPANGKFLSEQDDDWIQQLECPNGVNEVSLWRGMSGAPVFIKDSHCLAGIIIETPRKYWKDNQTQAPVHPERLYALSIPYLQQHCEVFRAVLQSLRTDQETRARYYQLAKPLLEKTEIFSQLQCVCTVDESDSKVLFEHLTTLPVNQFFDKFIECKQRGVCELTLGALAEILLPMFVDNTNVSKVRYDGDSQIIAVPYARKSVIESLMARADQLPMDFLAVQDDGEFIATYSLPTAPECAEDDDLRIKSMGKHLSNQFGADLKRLAAHTRRLLRGASIGDIARPLTGEEAVQFAQDQLADDREDGKRRYYLIMAEADKGSTYYQQLKMIFPQCAILLPQVNSQQLRDERKAYRKITDLLSPYLNQKSSKDKS